jgi:penicillin-binding protein 2
MHKKYSTASESNRIANYYNPAPRGLIIDRNGIVIANNFPSYSLEVNPSEINYTPQELLEVLEKIIPISSKDKQQF